MYDLVVIGAGSGGITAAQFGARLGVKVALVEKHRIGGDCTWTGCVPSKALLKIAKTAHAVRTASQVGIESGGPPRVDMAAVRAAVRRAVAGVYRHETPEKLAAEGIEVLFGAARFVDPHTLRAGEQTLTAKKFIIATGARPFIPPVPGLADVPYQTYLQIFNNQHLPEHLLVMGAGPIGVELAQAYRRLGARVTLVDVGLLPREEPEVAQVMGRVFAREGIEFVTGLVSAARQEGGQTVITVAGQEYRGDVLLVAVGRAPNVAGLNLAQAGVRATPNGIPVDDYLRTSARHIFAAGDVIAGNYQFTHFAGWQGYKAVRNALLPGNERGVTGVMPWTTFTEPEVAHVGLSEADARRKFGADVRVSRRNLSRVDRAVAEDDRDGFVKIIHRANGKLLGATIVAGRAGEMIGEISLALQRGLKLIDVANVIHVYPSYSMATMRLAAEAETDRVMGSWLGKILRRLAGGRTPMSKEQLTIVKEQ